MPTTALIIALATQHDAEADADGSGGPAVFVISLPDGVRGRLEEAHLGDHPAAVAALAECIEPGTDLGGLLVLERLEARSSSCAACYLQLYRLRLPARLNRRLCSCANPARALLLSRAQLCITGQACYKNKS